jgi:hypothetical protein
MRPGLSGFLVLLLAYTPAQGQNCPPPLDAALRLVRDGSIHVDTDRDPTAVRAQFRAGIVEVLGRDRTGGRWTRWFGMGSGFLAVRT